MTVELYEKTTALPQAGNRRDLEIAQLQATVTARMQDLLGDDTPFALLDFPDHGNVGDSAIYAGEVAYLQRRGLRPSYVSAFHNTDWTTLEKSIDGGSILLHGGGNFGDVWPKHHDFRERVLETFSGRPVVQLPQTIHFSSEQRADETARLIERHGAFTLLVRDRRSFDFATKRFQCNVRLCPDMAYFADLGRGAAPRHDLVVLRRLDLESASGNDLDSMHSIPGTLVSDWAPEAAGFQKREQQRHAARLAVARLRGRQSYLHTRFELIARERVRRGVDLLSSGRAVITDRLHAHILSFILAIPHCVLDNTYGKISTYLDTWALPRADAALVRSAEAAREWHRHLAGRAAA